MGSDIANDQIIDIVLTLPAKSIVRWMLTSKSWYSFIKSSQFITRHLIHSKTKDHRVLIVKEGSFSIFYESDTTLIEEESGRIPFPVIGQDLYILGSCRGLVLVRLKARDCWLVLLWNPSLEKFKIIDTVMFDRPCDGDEIGVSSCLCVFALGFHETSNDYRVVRIDKSMITEDDLHFLIDVVDVYSLTTDSWHRVDVNLPDDIRFTSKRAVYVNGAAHWLASYRSNWEEPGCLGILLFDFYNEVFKLIDLPVHYESQDRESYPLDLKEFDGKLALFADAHIPAHIYDECYILTWVMMNHPLAESWTACDGLFEHQAKKEPRPELDCLFVYRENQMLWPLICTEKKNCVFRTINLAYEHSLLYYNAREDKVSDLGVATPYISPIIVDFVECLVLLDVENPVLDDTQ